MREDTQLQFVALSLVKNLGHINARKLISSLGNIDEVYRAQKNVLKKILIQHNIVEQIYLKKTWKNAEKELEFIESREARCITLNDSEYPYRLKECHDAPIVLYASGSGNMNIGKFLAVVGTRKPQTQGRDLCKKLIGDLHGQDITVISGLAYGIDTLAHESALDNGLDTIAVLGHGLNKVYPWTNRGLAERICEKGLLLTEYPVSAPMVPGNFPARNRIIAGLSDAVVVVESDVEGGSIITADLANSYNRDTFTFPYAPMQPKSSGGNQLIKENKAGLIENADDLLDFMDWKKEDLPPQSEQLNLFEALNEDEKQIMDVLKDKKELNIDSISVLLAKPVAKISSLLLEMELRNLVLSRPGGNYRSALR